MLDRLVSKYKRRGVMLDSNLLVVYLVGLLGKDHLKDCRATKAVVPGDFDLLAAFLGQFEAFATTPHILTETSNLGGRLPENLHRHFRLLFRKLTAGFKERSRRANELMAGENFLRFGLADAAIADTPPGRFLVLTDEVALYTLLLSRGVDVINFNHLREFAWKYRKYR